MKTKSFFCVAPLFSYHKSYSCACHLLATNSCFTHLYCLQGLWQWRVPWGCRQGQRLLPPRYPVTWWLRASARCCSCPARTSMPLVAEGYLPCPRWPVSSHTNKHIRNIKINTWVTLKKKKKKSLFGSIKWWHADAEMKWMKCWAEASHLLGLKYTYEESKRTCCCVDGIFDKFN